MSVRQPRSLDTNARHQATSGVWQHLNTIDWTPGDARSVGNKRSFQIGQDPSSVEAQGAFTHLPFHAAFEQVAMAVTVCKILGINAGEAWHRLTYFLDGMQLLQQLERGNQAVCRTHEQQLNSLKATRDLLECSLLRLDDMHALFNDF